MEDIRTTISLAFKGAARWQIITTIFLALPVAIFGGVHAAVSVLIGGVSALMGGYVGVATIRKSKGNLAPGVVLITLLKAEVIKLVVIALLLLATFKFYQELVSPALIGGLAVAVLISGAGLRTLSVDNK